MNLKRKINRYYSDQVNRVTLPDLPEYAALPDFGFEEGSHRQAHTNKLGYALTLGLIIVLTTASRNYRNAGALAVAEHSRGEEYSELFNHLIIDFSEYLNSTDMFIQGVNK